jgi:glycosyl transferase family 25
MKRVKRATFFEPFDRIDIVSLPHRTDRRRQMIESLRQVGLSDDSRVQFFDAYRIEDRGPFRRPGSHGCFMSHLAILNQAAEAGQSVLILQDDCQFLPDIVTYRLPEGTDVFYGGYTAADSTDLDSSDIVGAHFMGFSARAAEAAAIYLTNLLDPDFPPDPKAAAQLGFNADVRPPIDGSLVWFRRAHPNFKTVFKLLSLQRSSRSDVTPGRLDKLPVVGRLMDMAHVVRSRIVARRVRYRHRTGDHS